MACDHLDRLHGYLDNELDAAGAVEFERHLPSCGECNAALAGERALRNTLLSAQLYERAPATLREKIRFQVTPRSVANPEAALNWKWLAIAAMVLFAGSTGILTVNLVRNRGEAPPLAIAAVDAHLRSLQQGHLADVQSTDQHTVKPWFEGRIDFAPKVTDFSNQGFPLLGGRLDILNGKTVAALVYGRRKHVINIFIAQQGGIGTQSAVGELRGYHWLAWSVGGFDYIAVSDVAAADLEELRLLSVKE